MSRTNTSRCRCSWWIRWINKKQTHQTICTWSRATFPRLPVGSQHAPVLRTRRNCSAAFVDEIFRTRCLLVKGVCYLAIRRQQNTQIKCTICGGESCEEYFYSTKQSEGRVSITSVSVVSEFVFIRTHTNTNSDKNFFLLTSCTRWAKVKSAVSTNNSTYRWQYCISQMTFLTVFHLKREICSIEEVARIGTKLHVTL